MKAEVEIITPSWGEQFGELLDNTTNSLKIMSPFVKLGMSRFLLEKCGKDVAIDLLTTIKIGNFANGASDIPALKLLGENEVSIKNTRNLHAKIYIFDEKRFVVTSANLTHSGFHRNIEYGLLIDSPGLTREMVTHYNALFSDANRSFDIDLDSLDEASKILAKISRPKKELDKELLEIEKKFFETESQTDILVGKTDEIHSTLSGWKREVFEVLMEIPKNVFTLKQLNQYESRFQELHPESTTVMARARQTLQQLRDMGLIEFVDNRGTYRKLWE